MKRWASKLVGWKFSVVWIGYMSIASAWNIFSVVHPGHKAFGLWIYVPLVGVLAYLLGRLDSQRERLRREIDQLEKEVADLEVMHMKTRFHFKKDDSVN